MSSIVFFIVIIGIDLLLKSAKDKKKIEAERAKKIKEMQRSRPGHMETMETGPMQGTPVEEKRVRAKPRQVEPVRLEDMLEAEKRHKDRMMDIRGYKPQLGDSSLEDLSQMRGEFHRKGPQEKDREDERKKGKIKRVDLEGDLLRGIIFAEILSEPKSIQNMKRGM